MKSIVLISFTIVLLLAFGNKKAIAQMKVGNNPTTINAGALMEFESTNKGILLPRVALSDTATWSLAGSAVEGMMVYNTATVSGKFNPGLYVFKTSKWNSIASGVGTNVYWSTTGNAGNSWRTNFIGNTDNVSLRFRTNNTFRMILDSTGKLGIGTSSPSTMFDVNGAARIRTLASGAATDSIVTVDINGNLHKRNISSVLSTSHTLSSSANTITSVVNGISVTANAVNSISNTSSANNLSTTVNGVSGSNVSIINSISNTSATNSLTTTVNGVAGSAVNIINSNATSLSGTNLTTTVNGVAATALDLTPAINSKAWSLSGNSGTTAGTNFIGTTDNVDLQIKRFSVPAGLIGTTNTVLGLNAGNIAASTGTYNTANGVYALNLNTSGTLNAAFGGFALGKNTTGSNNTGLGYGALYNNTTGGLNTGVGQKALYNSTTAVNNSAFGYNALFTNITGSNNTAIGLQAMFLIPLAEAMWPWVVLHYTAIHQG